MFDTIRDNQLHIHLATTETSEAEWAADQFETECRHMARVLTDKYDLFFVDSWEVENPVNPDQLVPDIGVKGYPMMILPNPDDSTYTVEDHNRGNMRRLKGLSFDELLTYVGIILRQYGETLEDYKK